MDVTRAQDIVAAVYRFFDRRSYRVAAISVAVALAVVGAFLFAVGSVIHANLLNEDFYEQAFDESRAYDRVYEDVLSDPELAADINRALNVSDTERSLAVSALRVLIPPESLENWTEDGLEAMVDYLAGRRDSLEPNVDLLALPLNRVEASSVQLERDVAEAEERRVESATQLVATVGAVRDALVRGQVPDEVPAGETDAESLQAVASAILSPLNAAARDAIEEQVIAHLTADDIRGALAIAAPYLAQFSAGSGGEDGDDALAGASSQINGWLGQLVDGVRPLHDAIRRFGPWMLPLAIVSLVLAWLLAGAAAGGDTSKRTAFASAVVIVGALVTGMVFYTMAPDMLDRRFDSATGGEVLGAMPESVRALVSDIQSRMVSNMAWTGTASMVWIGAAGLISTVIPLGIEFGQIRGKINLKHPVVVPVGMFALLAVALTVGPFALELNADERAKPCNGHVDLCDLRYDEVLFPATHNSMSSSSEGWIFPYQDGSIESQLDEGVRTFLIDAHRWGSPDQYLEQINEIEGLSANARIYLASLRGRFTSAPEGVFLCHATCWLGAQRLDDALEQIRDFMELHPREVVTLIIQDEVDSSDIISAFKRTGLDDLAHSQPVGDEWPSLEDMIESERRLVVFAEQSSGPETWFHHAWTYMWDTRFDYRSVDELDCELNRGSQEHRLMLANHWIRAAVPDRADASRMNSQQQLNDRVAGCVESQGRTPNFLAVDFYRIGDLMRVVDEVNGIGVRR